MRRWYIAIVALSACLVFSGQALEAQQRGKGPGFGQGRGRGGQTQSQQGAGRGMGGMGGMQSTTGAAGTSLNADSLIRMWDEEKLARDVYTSLSKTSNLPIFQKIAGAESRHMQSMEGLIAASGGAAATLNKTPGVFLVPEHQQLYTSLVAAGSQSPVEALKVGAKIEEMDIADLQIVLGQTADRRQQQVLQNLMRGSYNHLQAFSGQLTQQGASYQAQFLPQADFDRIAQGGNGQQGGQGGQMGQGAQGGPFGQGGQFGQTGQGSRGGQGGPQMRGRGNGAGGGNRGGGGRGR